MYARRALVREAVERYRARHGYVPSIPEVAREFARDRPDLPASRSTIRRDYKVLGLRGWH